MTKLAKYVIIGHLERLEVKECTWVTPQPGVSLAPTAKTSVGERRRKKKEEHLGGKEV